MLYYSTLRFDDCNNVTPAVVLKLLTHNSDNYTVTEYLIAHELKKKKKISHYHFQFTFETENTHKYVNGQIRKLLFKLLKAGSKLYVAKTSNVEKNIIYILKDGKIWKDTIIDRDLMKLCQEITDRVNAEKGIKMKVQLLNYFMKIPNLHDNNPAIMVEKIYVNIIEYHCFRDYLPPSRTLLTQYSAYICFNMFKNKMFYRELITTIYNL